jgi:hypothetical protein
MLFALSCTLDGSVSGFGAIGCVCLLAPSLLIRSQGDKIKVTSLPIQPHNQAQRLINDVDLVFSSIANSFGTFGNARGLFQANDFAFM